MSMPTQNYDSLMLFHVDPVVGYVQFAIRQGRKQTRFWETLPSIPVVGHVGAPVRLSVPSRHGLWMIVDVMVTRCWS